MKTLEMWLAEHVEMLRTLSVHTAAEKKLLKLASLQTPTSTEMRHLKKIADAQRTLARGKKKAAEVTSMLRSARNKDRGAARRIRTDNLIDAAELMVKAGLLSNENGLPHVDRATLLGSFLGLANLDPDHPKFAIWKVKGQAKLDEVQPDKADKVSVGPPEMEVPDINEAMLPVDFEDGFNAAVISQKEELTALDGDPPDDEEGSLDA